MIASFISPEYIIGYSGQLFKSDDIFPHRFLFSRTQKSGDFCVQRNEVSSGIARDKVGD